MSAIDQRFQWFKSQGRCGLLPFITAGDPHLAFTLQLLETFNNLECCVAEVGFPYSDPIADGPVIQASYHRALERGFRMEALFQQTQHAYQNREMPLAGMVSYAMIHRRGLEKFVDDAQAAGFSGVIVPDLLVEEASRFAKICRAADFSLIQLITPTTSAERAIRIAEQSTGFLYLVAVTGITGERRELPDALLGRIEWLRLQTSLPICVGFGISTPEQVQQLAKVADGVIVGSALVKYLSRCTESNESQGLAEITQFVQQLQHGLQQGAS